MRHRTNQTKDEFNLKFYESTKFKETQKEWYDKLKANGFKDIEITIGNEQKLLQYSNGFKITDDHKLSYYQALTYFVQFEVFKNDTDKLIMTKRADGMKIKDISTILKFEELKPSHRETIRYIIRKYEVRWGLRHYKPSQLSSKRFKNE